MTPDAFIAKWKASTLKERSASQSHFNDLCDVLGVDKPTDVDPKGDWYCFERGASKTAGGEGWSDVWKRGHFGWEYKGKRKDLTAAYAQLQQYAVALENPPLLVVSDMERFVIHTNWTNTVSEKHIIELEHLNDAKKRDILRYVFTNPDQLKPEKTVDALTRNAADKFAQIAITLCERGHDPQKVAHFINRMVFCMFAEDINLLPRNLFRQICDRGYQKPEIAKQLLEQLFEAMRQGGLFGVDEIEWFNGGLFDDKSALPLKREDLKVIGQAAALDWSDIDPSIFGTLFERGLDPAKRSQLGAHYTDPEKIMMIIRPVIIDPLWREWELVKGSMVKPRVGEKKKRELLAGFLERLRQFRILDPACGSGNFLYLALLAIKDIEHRVNLEAEALGLGRQFPSVSPQAVQGIEINPYAAELARITVWIGEIQWMRKNGFDVERKPILKPLKHIENRDALLNPDGSEATWPAADAIVGNPPFLGDRKLIGELGEPYVNSLRKRYKGRVPGGADLVCYWFAKAWDCVNDGSTKYAGLVSTNSISGGLNREVLKPIVETGCIYNSHDDEPWAVDGAAVRVALVSFCKAATNTTLLNNVPVPKIFSNLTASASGLDLTKAKRLKENANVAFIGTMKNGPFNVSYEQACIWANMPVNPNGRPNTDVLRPWVNGLDVARRPSYQWIIDFDPDDTPKTLAFYEAPFKHVLQNVKPLRDPLRRKAYREQWWRYQEPQLKMRRGISKLKRYIITPRVSKHRLFAWLDSSIIPDSACVAVCRDDDVTFGILHSKYHEAWTLGLCTFLGVGNDPRYTPTSTFETFPFPKGLTLDASNHVIKDGKGSMAIAKAAIELDKARKAWLNPQDLVKVEPAFISNFPPRYVPVSDAASQQLKKRTLTNLYNERPTWLDNAHRELDAAVAAAYGWPDDISTEDALTALLALNVERVAGQAKD